MCITVLTPAPEKRVLSFLKKWGSKWQSNLPKTVKPSLKYRSGWHKSPCPLNEDLLSQIIVIHSLRARSGSLSHRGKKCKPQRGSGVKGTGWNARTHPTSVWRGVYPGQPWASHGWCAPCPRPCPLPTNKCGMAVVPGKFSCNADPSRGWWDPSAAEVMPPPPPAMKVILKEPLSKQSIFSSLTVDSSLLISRELWLKTAARSFTFNYSPVEGLFKKKKKKNSNS